MRFRLAALLAALAASSGGCGTIVNLSAPPPPGPHGIGPTSCFAFGGVTRSAMLGCALPVLGGVGCLEGGGAGLVGGTALVVAGVWTLAVDAPLSLAGDLLTLPVAVARSSGAPWATSWGAQAADKTVPAEDRPAEDPLPTPPELPAKVGAGPAPPDGTAPAARPLEPTEDGEPSKQE